MNSALAADITACEAEAEQAATQTQSKPHVKRERAGRQALPDHLPRIKHRHEPVSCTCGKCGAALVKIGDDVSEMLDVIPAQFIVHRHIHPQYACRPCETMVPAPIPPAVIDGGMASIGLLVWLIIGKYLEHQPLYRLEQIAARSGVILSRSTLAEWVGRIGVALQPLTDRLAELLLKQGVLHTDETPGAQLDPGRGRTQRAYQWAYRSNVLGTGIGGACGRFRGSAFASPDSHQFGGGADTLTSTANPCARSGSPNDRSAGFDKLPTADRQNKVPCRKPKT
jgi:transposase